MTRTLIAADLFCGAGGTSQGAEDSGAARVVCAVNHWDVAIRTHAANFPLAKHIHSRLDQVNPSECPHVDLLFASPECTHHSRARGGKPTSDQQRAGAWDLMRWVEFHRPSWIVVENVAEFREWGPIGDNGTPLVKFRGRFFATWLQAIEAAGYKTEHRLLNAADFGAATSRSRLFVIARKGNRSIHWPEPTHGRRAGGELPGLGVLPWRAAAEVIDWSLELPSVFARKVPLRDKTLARIEAGIRRFVGPFVTTQRGTSDVSSTAKHLRQPLGTITAGGRHHGVVLPLVASTHFGGHYVPANQRPCPTIRCRNGALLAVPFLVQTSHTGTTGRARYDLDSTVPLRTIGTRQEFGVVVPFLADVNHGLDGPQAARVNDLNRPLGAITGSRGKAVIAPLVLSYYSNGKAQPVTSPLGTITTNDRFAVLLPAAGESDFAGRSAGERSLLTVMRELGVLDIGFRMLANHELAAAQGFGNNYIFHGNKSDVTRQIGNSVSPPVAKAITLALAGV